MDEKGELNPNDAQFHRFDVAGMRGFSRKIGALKVLAILLVVVAFFGVSIAMLHDSNSGTFRCNFPPCIRVP